MKIIGYGIVLFCLFFQIIAVAQTPPPICHVSGQDITGGLKGEPPLYFGEVLPKYDEVTTKSFVFPDTDLVVTLSVKYRFFYNGTDIVPTGGLLDMVILEKAEASDSDLMNGTAGRKTFVKKFSGMKTAGLATWKDKTYRFFAFCTREDKPTKHD